MIQFITKLLIYRQIYNFIKERIVGISFTAIMIFLIIYIHSEYLNYVEFKEKTSANYIGLSFIIKNTLILSIVFGYIYFYRKINQTKVSIQETKETIIKENKTDDKERVSSLDQFLEDDEIDR